MLHEKGLSEYVLMFTGDVGENGLEDRMKPDLSLYRRRDEQAYMSVTTGATAGKTSVSLDEHGQGNYKARTAWAWIVSLVEIKASDDSRPFLNFSEKSTPLKMGTSEYGAGARAQMVSYAAEAQLRQHRTFFLTAFIHQRHVRFMRWDRTGALVSDPVDYIEDPEPLLRFFFYLALADKRMRWGYDSSAVLAEDQHVSRLRALRSELDGQRGEEEDKGKWQRRYIDNILTSQKFHPIYRVSSLCCDCFVLFDLILR